MNFLWLPSLPRNFSTCQSIDSNIILEYRKHLNILNLIFFFLPPLIYLIPIAFGKEKHYFLTKETVVS